MTDEEFELPDDWYEIEEPEDEPDPIMYVMGLDPGETTGVAMLRFDLSDDKVKPELIYLHQITGGHVGFYEWFEGSRPGKNLIIVSEKWRERNIKGANREPLVIQGVEYALWQENINWQYPDVKELIPDEWLEKNNFWTPNKRHQMDALKHAFAYLRNEEHSATLDSLSGEDEDAMAQPGTGQKSQLVDPSEDGEPGEAQEGDGEGDGLSPAEQALVEALAKAIAEAAQGEPADGESEGIGGSGIDENPTGGYDGEDLLPGGYGDVPEETIKRTRRERNGAFAGYNPADFEEGATTLLVD